VLKKLLRSRRRDSRGAAAVEFAFVMVPFFVMIIGMIQYGWYFYTASNTSGATSTVARKLQVGDCWTSGAALSYVQKQAPQATSLSTTPAVTSPPAVGTTFTVVVKANGKIMPFLPMPGGGVITRTVTANMEDTTPSSC
jgi:Flp pilus assembly protein TadG